MSTRILVLAFTAMLGGSVFAADMSSVQEPAAIGRVVCVARNAAGRRFEAEGLFPGRVQVLAMDKCRAAGSLQCTALGCR